MKILFKNANNSVSVLTPTEKALLIATVSQIAEKDVPFELPYWILEDSEIPNDRTYRNGWRIDPAWGDPDGFGGESNKFDAQLLAEFQAENGGE